VLLPEGEFGVELLAGRKKERDCPEIYFNLLWKASLKPCVCCLIGSLGTILLHSIDMCIVPFGMR